MQLQFLNLKESKCNVSAIERFLSMMFKFSLKCLYLENFVLRFQDHELFFEINEGCENYSGLQFFLSALLAYNLSYQVKIEVLQITGVNLTSFYTNCFQKVLKEYSIKALILIECSITPSFIEPLIHTIHSLNTLRSLVLYCFPVGPSMITAFQTLAPCSSLEQLYISSNEPQDEPISEQVKEIGVSLKTFLEENHHLQLLGLKPCPAYVLNCLMDGLLKNKVLQFLELSDNIMTDSRQTEALEMILKSSSTLLSLNLSNCTFTEIGLNHIASGVMSNVSLKSLMIDEWKVVSTSDTHEQIPKLLQKLFLNSLKNHKSIHKLSMCKNELDFTMVHDLIRHNKVITTFEVDGCGFTEDQLRQIALLAQDHLICSADCLETQDRIAGSTEKQSPQDDSAQKQLSQDSDSSQRQSLNFQEKLSNSEELDPSGEDSPDSPDNSSQSCQLF